MALREFNFYDFTSIIGPGVVAGFGAYTLCPVGEDKADLLHLDLGGIAMLLVMAYVLGYLRTRSAPAERALLLGPCQPRLLSSVVRQGPPKLVLLGWGRAGASELNEYKNRV